MLTKLWQVIASYTYVHARITKTTTRVQLNTEPMNTPTHAFSLWTTYDVTTQWQVGGGAFYNSDVYGDTGQSGSASPAWWRFDLMAAYKINAEDDVAVQHLQSHRQALLRVRLFELGGSRLRAARRADVARQVLIAAACDAPRSFGLTPARGFCRGGRSAVSRYADCRSTTMRSRSRRHDAPHPGGADPGAGRALPRGDDQGRMGRRQRHRRPPVARR